MKGMYWLDHYEAGGEMFTRAMVAEAFEDGRRANESEAERQRRESDARLARILDHNRPLPR